MLNKAEKEMQGKEPLLSGQEIPEDSPNLALSVSNFKISFVTKNTRRF